MPELVCLAHGLAPAGHEPRGILPCDLVPVEAVVTVRITYQADCALCGGPLDGGCHDKLEDALADRRQHVNSHLDGRYG